MSAGSTLIADTPFLSTRARAEAEGGDVRYVATSCEMCFWKCGVIAKVQKNKKGEDVVVKLEGNPFHPQSNGKLCARGQGGIGQLYNENRLKKPLIRREGTQRGAGEYDEVSWEDALNYTAEKLKKVAKQYGPHAAAMMSHGSSGDYISNLLWAMGSENIAFPSFAQCKGIRDQAWKLTYGHKPGSSCERVDLKNSKVIVLIGTHLGENMHNSQNQEFAEAVGRGAKIICVDPRYSTAASKASLWLPIKPGTDTALLLTWINLIISNGWYDKNYVAQYTVGFEELQEAVKQYTSAWCAKETDLHEADIIEAARVLGRYAPNVVIHPGRHVAWYGDDTQRSRAMAILSAILGSWGREGGIWLPPKGKLAGFHDSIPEYPIPDEDPIVRGNYPFTGGAGLTQVLRDVTIKGKPYPIKAWFVCGSNLLKSLPAPEETKRAINELDLLVAVDILPTDTVMMADVILPECTYLERHDGLYKIETRETGVALRQPAVQPMYESKPAWWIGSMLCNKMGLKEFAVKDSSMNDLQAWEQRMRRHAKAWKIDFDTLADQGYVSIPDSEAPYITPDNPPVFKTPSKKIELFSSKLDKKHFDPIPKYEPVAPPPKGMYRLVYGRSPVHTFSRTIDDKWLWELHKENQVWLNKQEAARLKLKDQQYVVLINQDEVVSNKVRVKVTERIRRDCVYLVHGFGHNSKWLKRAYHKGADDQQLITRYKVDPITGGTGMRVNFVTIKEA
jgi:thiosulfate reductase/polysulfide reductase chain A